ncbi:MAG: tetratricopeptide repeat protein [Acidobacteriota bacterium]|nr:tetratricopeptide repeat protein [Acidobacteriota bacterium]
MAQRSEASNNAAIHLAVAALFFLAWLPSSLKATTNPEDAQKLFINCQQALERNDLGASASCFREVLAIDPQNPGALANLGVVAMRRKRWTEALGYLTQAEKLAPEVSGIRLNIGLAYYQQAKYKQAIPAFESVLKESNRPSQPRYLLGLCYFYTGRYGDALRELEPLWPQESKNLSYLYVLSVSAGQTGDHGLENQAAARMLQVGADSPEMQLLVGKAQLVREHNDAALRSLKSAASADPTLPYVHFYLGIAYRRTNDFQQAKTEFLKELAIDPSGAYTYDELGSVCAALQENSEAEGYYRKALSINPDLASSEFGLAKVLMMRKEYSEALSALARAGRLDPASASVHYLRGRVMLAQGRKAEAQSEFQIAARMQRGVRDKLLEEISGKALPNPDAEKVQ